MAVDNFQIIGNRAIDETPSKPLKANGSDPICFCTAEPTTRCSGY
jgi:hypothetical protein